MDLIKLQIITPEKVIYQNENIKSVTIPTADGEITILPHHIPLVSQVVPGEIIIMSVDKEESLVTAEGFLKLNSEGKLTILADYAVRSDEIEIAKVEEAKRKAEQAMKEKTSEKDFAIAEAELRKTLIELRVAHKKKQRGI